MMPYSLADKVVLITGAARGQGAAEVELLGGLGATVIACDVLDDGESPVRYLDVTDAAGWAKVVTDVTAAHGRIDVLRSRLRREGGDLLAGVLENFAGAAGAVRDILVNYPEITCGIENWQRRRAETEAVAVQDQVRRRITAGRQLVRGVAESHYGVG